MPPAMRKKKANITRPFVTPLIVRTFVGSMRR
jgi:hypothetical protein